MPAHGHAHSHSPTRCALVALSTGGWAEGGGRACPLDRGGCLLLMEALLASTKHDQQAWNPCSACKGSTLAGADMFDLLQLEFVHALEAEWLSVCTC